MSPRATSVLLAVLLALAAEMFTGCGGDGVEETTTAGSVATTEAPTAAENAVSEEGKGGGGGHEETPEAEDAEAELISAKGQIMNAAGAFLASPKTEEVCGELVTQNLLASSYGGLQGCLDGRPNPTLAKRSRLEPPEIDGDRATVVATPDGGLYDGVEVEFTLVLEGETWLVDSVAADVPVGP